ncbi:transient receptor potential cation channel subfamily M member 2-like isoform X2 [Lissotriton helveticus]
MQGRKMPVTIQVSSNDNTSWMSKGESKDQQPNIWILDHIKKKECVKYIKSSKPDDEQEECFCGYSKEHHVKEAQIVTPGVKTDWDPKNDIQEMPTDSFGYFTIKDAGKGRRKYVRASNYTRSDILYEMMTKQWKLRIPNLVISVYGGTKDFTVTPTLKRLFTMGLISGAQSTGTWIITEGVNTNVVKHIGKAVRDFYVENSSSDMDCEILSIGITAWGIVCNQDVLINKAMMEPVEYTSDEENQGSLFCLDTNHSHFILVDDGTHGNHGVEIPLRMNLEKFLIEQSVSKRGMTINIPLVRVVLDGEESTLKIIFDAVRTGIPTVIVEDSGGIADVIAEVSNLKASEITVSLIEQKLHSLLKDSFTPNIEGRIVKWTKMIQDILRRSHLLTIYRQLEPQISDAKDMIFQALLKAQKSLVDHGNENLNYQMKLAVFWDRLDIAKDAVSQELEPEELYEIMTIALIENKPALVQLLLDHRVDLNMFLTWENLTLIYNSTDRWKLTRKMLMELAKKDKLLPSAQRVPGIQLHHVASALRVLLGEFSEPLYPRLKVYRPPPQSTPKNEDCIVAALACRKILLQLSRMEEHAETSNEMLALADRFGQRAVGVLSECCVKNENYAEELLTRVSVAWGGSSCLQLAVDANAKDFMSHGGVQMFLTKIWWGKLSTINSTFTVILCVLFLPLIYTDLVIFRTRTQKSFENEERKPPALSFLQRLANFYTAPVVIFYWNAVTFICFLLLFAYILMMDFHEVPSWREYLLYVWAFTSLCEEARQCFYDVEGVGLKKKVKLYIRDLQNKMDVLCSIIFLIGVFCRLFKRTLYAGKIIFSVDFILFSFRLMDMFAVNKFLGPKIIVMQKMMTDVVFFLCILFVSVLAYGVSKQAILVENEQRWGWILRNVIYEPYLILFGEISDVVDGLAYDEDVCSAQGVDPAKSKCPYNDGAGKPIFPEWLTIILQCLYLFFANILLLNLLIAIFSNTFAEVEDHTDEVWRFQRYTLITDYHNRPFAPPPFIIFCHLYIFIRYICRLHPSKGRIQLLRKLNKMETLSLLSWEAKMRDLYLKKVGSSKSTNTGENNADQETLLRAMEQRLTSLENQSALALNWIMSALSDMGFGSKGTAPILKTTKTQEEEKDLSAENIDSLRYVYHVSARDMLYPDSTIKRFPVPDEMVPWQVVFPQYNPSLYPVEDEEVQSQRNPMGRTGIWGLGSLEQYGSNSFWHLLLTCWKVDKAGSFIKKDSKKMLLLLVVKYSSSKEWTLPGGKLNPEDKIPSTLKDIGESESWEKLQALIEKEGKQVYRGYLDDARNTDNAWIETTVVHLHLRSHAQVDNLIQGGGRGNSLRWMLLNKKMPLFILKKDILKQVADLHGAYF